MFNLSDNYRLRQCYLKREQVPTQSVMRDKMTPALANVYFKSMSPKLKLLAGLEPPMKGGGSDWFVPPEELLKGRAVMKPTKKQYLMKLGFNGIDTFGDKLVYHHHQCLEEDKRNALHKSDENWKDTVRNSSYQYWQDMSNAAARENTKKIQKAFGEFQIVYATSLNKLESILFDAAINEIKRVRTKTHNKMLDLYKLLLKQQATMLYDKYEKKLIKESERQKQNFINQIEEAHRDMGQRLHDIKIEKYVVVEKLRPLFQCRNLACQVYVALKEREECQKEIDASKHAHQKRIKKLKEAIALKDFEISLEREKEKKRQEFNTLWQMKICHVVKRFQLFVAYCLKLLPEYAEFFLDMEKLMIMQIDNALENSSAPSLFENENEKFHTPVPRPHPFYLVCDKGFKPQIDENLVPERCTSSASQMPVIVVNKKLIYSACDNFETFKDRIKEFIHGRRDDDKYFEDDHKYELDVPVKYTASQQLREIKLESSLMQVLQKELPNVNDVSFECTMCKIPFCFCSPTHAANWDDTVVDDTKLTPSLCVIDPGIEIKSREVELKHEREPKWENYMEFVESKKCKCAQTSKKHLKEHLPPYMRKISKFDTAGVPNYELCSLKTLKSLVKKAKGIQSPPTPAKSVSKTRTVATQYSDHEFELLCTCFSDDEARDIFQKIIDEKKRSITDMTSGQHCDVLGGTQSPSYLERKTSDFVKETASSLRNLLHSSPELEEIFKRKGCIFN